jgi:hypothetical protein
MKIIVHMSVVAILIIAGCERTTLGFGELPVDREASVWMVPIAEYDPQAPFTKQGTLEIAVAISASISASDIGWQTFTKAELDFGEGAGWQDMTHEIQNLWWHTPDGADPLDTGYMTHHTYTQPGSYNVLGRVTYWTGEVVTAQGKYTVVIEP